MMDLKHPTKHRYQEGYLSLYQDPDLVTAYKEASDLKSPAKHRSQEGYL